jgi:DNA-binding MarR family transcriptional regulator
LSNPFPNQPPSASEAQVTSADVQAEHRAALLSLTPEQRRAIRRLQEAKQRSHFNGRYPEENLRAIFEAEAKTRSTTD